MGKRGRYFTDDFKRDAVQLVTEKWLSVRKVANDLNIHPNLLHQWRRKYLNEGEHAFVGKGHLKPEEAELKQLWRELEEVKEEQDILKKHWPSSPNETDTVSVHRGVQEGIQDSEDVYRAGVSRSGYYAWRQRTPSECQKANEELLERIREIHRNNRSVYGSPRITDELKDQGIVCGKNRVARIMKINGIRAQGVRRFRRTTDLRHSYLVADNLLMEDSQGYRVWASDIPYISTHEGWMYLSAVMDIQTRKIIGLSMQDRFSQSLTSEALLHFAASAEAGEARREVNSSF